MRTILDQQEIYSNFYDSLKSPKTKYIYSFYLKTFMKFHKIEEGNYAALFENPEQKIKDYLIAASKKDYAIAHFRIMISCLKNFYSMNDYDEIKWAKLKRFIGETKPKHQYVPIHMMRF